MLGTGEIIPATISRGKKQPIRDEANVRRLLRRLMQILPGLKLQASSNQRNAEIMAQIALMASMSLVAAE